MTGQFKYVSANGHVVDVDSTEMAVGIAGGVRSSSWSYSLSQSGALSGVSRSAREADMLITSRDLDAAYDSFLIFESDMNARTPGKITWNGEWAQSALIADVGIAEISPNSVSLSVKVLLLDGAWMRRRVIHLAPNSGQIGVTDGLDYPTDYPYDLQLDESTGKAITVGAGGCLVGVTFFGPCSSPYVHVGSNTYGVNASVPYGSRIVIDPLGRKKVGGSVYSVGPWGERENLFDKRFEGASGSGSYVFERLDEGQYFVTWPQSYGVDLELIEEVGIPPWI